MDDSPAALLRSLVDGLEGSPPSIDFRHLYDAEGSRLFERITTLPEYYPTRTESSILERHAGEIASLVGPLPLVEFGAGSGKKTAMLLESFEGVHGFARYVPVDVSRSALEHALTSLSKRHRRTRITPVLGSHETALLLLENLGPSLGVFLGSSIGNFTEDEEHRFLGDLEKRLRGGGAFLLGVDLVKDSEIIERAYNDSAGLTAQFIANVFRRIVRELGAQLDMKGFHCEAKYDRSLERIEIHARFDEGIRLPRDPLGRVTEVEPGEPILIEICRKYRLESLEKRLRAHDLDVLKIFVDQNEWFADLVIAHHGACIRRSNDQRDIHQ